MRHAWSCCKYGGGTVTPATDKDTLGCNETRMEGLDVGVGGVADVADECQLEAADAETDDASYQPLSCM